MLTEGKEPVGGHHCVWKQELGSFWSSRQADSQETAISYATSHTYGLMLPVESESIEQQRVACYYAQGLSLPAWELQESERKPMFFESIDLGMDKQLISMDSASRGIGANHTLATKYERKGHTTELWPHSLVPNDQAFLELREASGLIKALQVDCN